MSKSSFTFHQRRIMVRERKRIRFLSNRDSDDALKRFCEQGISQYIRALSTGYGKVYHESLRASIIMYIRFIKFGKF